MGKREKRRRVVETTLCVCKGAVHNEFLSQEVLSEGLLALAIAKSPRITLIVGDWAFRKAAKEENVSVMGTIGILNQLYDGAYIGREEYLECLKLLHRYKGGKVRLPEELVRRIETL